MRLGASFRDDCERLLAAAGTAEWERQRHASSVASVKRASESSESPYALGGKVEMLAKCCSYDASRYASRLDKRAATTKSIKYFADSTYVRTLLEHACACC